MRPLPAYTPRDPSCNLHSLSCTWRSVSVVLMHGQPVDAEVTTIFDNALKSKSRGDKSDIPVMILQDIALSGLFRRCGLCKKNAR